MNKKDNFLKGIFSENPILVSVLGLCPSLAITTSVENGIGMGLAIIFVLTFSSILISLIRKLIPNEIRIPVFIVIIATFVTVVDMLLKAYLLSLSKKLGIYISLIVVNCIVLGRAEAFSSKNKISDSIIDSLGMGIGYMIVLIVISLIRELISFGTITIWGNLSLNINNLFYNEEVFPIFTSFFASPAGGFIILGLIFSVVSFIKNKKKDVSK